MKSKLVLFALSLMSFTLIHSSNTPDKWQPKKGSLGKINFKKEDEQPTGTSKNNIPKVKNKDGAPITFGHLETEKQKEDQLKGEIRTFFNQVESGDLFKEMKLKAARQMAAAQKIIVHFSDSDDNDDTAFDPEEIKTTHNRLKPADWKEKQAALQAAALKEQQRKKTQRAALSSKSCTNLSQSCMDLSKIDIAPEKEKTHKRSGSGQLSVSDLGNFSKETVTGAKTGTNLYTFMG